MSSCNANQRTWTATRCGLLTYRMWGPHIEPAADEYWPETVVPLCFIPLILFCQGPISSCKQTGVSPHTYISDHKCMYMFRYKSINNTKINALVCVGVCVPWKAMKLVDSGGFQGSFRGHLALCKKRASPGKAGWYLSALGETYVSDWSVMLGDGWSSIFHNR